MLFYVGKLEQEVKSERCAPAELEERQTENCLCGEEQLGATDSLRKLRKVPGQYLAK